MTVRASPMGEVVPDQAAPGRSSSRSRSRWSRAGGRSSPCVIRCCPATSSYATGLSGADLANGVAGTRRGRMFAGSVLFVPGFTVVS